MNRFLLLASLGLSAVGLSQCKSFKGATVKVNPNPLEVHADSIRFTIKATIPPKSGFSKKGVYNGKVVIQNGGSKYDITSVTASSAQYKDIKKTGANMTVTAGTAFDEGMDGGKLMAMNSYTKGKKTVELDPLELAPCCITTSRLVYEENQFLYTKNTYEKKVPVTLEAKIQFPQNVAELQPNEMTKGEVKAIGDFLSKKYIAKKVTISGYASPEGKFSRNKFLSVERSEQVKKWLIDQLKKAGYEVYLDSTFFAITTTTEDWNGFIERLQSTTYSDDVKRQIAEIVKSGIDEDAKEKKIMALVGGEKEVEYILAPLRRATIKLEGFTAAREDAEIDQVAKDFLSGKIKENEIQSKFAQEEFLYAISRVEKDQDKLKLYEAYSKKYTQDYRGLNEMGVLSLKLGKVDQAFDYLNKANQIKAKDPIVLNNLGVAYKKKGNLSEAANKFKESYSAQATPEAYFNAGVILEKQAQYSMAAEMFDKAKSITGAQYNSGLCKLLLGDVSGAKTELEAAINKDKNRALNYYVLAIAGARSADSNLLLTNLKRAVQLDKELSIKAQNDLEFRNYYSSNEFKVATQP